MKRGGCISRPVRAFLKICSKPRNLRLYRDPLSAVYFQDGHSKFRFLLHGQVDGGMEPKSTLVRAQGRVELHSVASVHAQLAVVVLPGDAELHDTLGDGHDLEGGAVLGVLLEEGAVFEGAGQLCLKW